MVKRNSRTTTLRFAWRHYFGYISIAACALPCLTKGLEKHVDPPLTNVKNFGKVHEGYSYETEGQQYDARFRSTMDQDASTRTLYMLFIPSLCSLDNDHELLDTLAHAWLSMMDRGNSSIYNVNKCDCVNTQVQLSVMLGHLRISSHQE